MNSMTQTANHSTTIASEQAGIGAAIAALLAQVPAQLADQFQEAIESNLDYVFRVGMNAGKKMAWDAMAEYGFIPASTQSTRQQRHLTLVGGA